MELWDAYKEDGTLAGCDLVRGEKIPKGLYHMVCEILVRHSDGSFLLTQRDYSKPNHAGCFEMSAGGSVVKGENAYDAAVRELQEETGIVTDHLEHIYTDKNQHTIYEGFLCETDHQKDQIRLQEGETISYLWLGTEEFLDFIESEKCIQVRKKRLEPYLEKLKKDKNSGSSKA